MDDGQILAPSAHNLLLNESAEGRKVHNEKIRGIFSSFMTRIAKLDELVDAANRFLGGFKQALDFLRRPSIDMTNVVLEQLVKNNSTRDLLSYIEAGCFNVYDSKQNISKCMIITCFKKLSQMLLSYVATLLAILRVGINSHATLLEKALDLEVYTCHLGLMDHIAKAKSVVKELERLLHDAEEVVQATIDDLHPSQDNDDDFDLKSYLSPFSQEKVPSSVLQKPEITDYAILMAFVYWMVKRDHEMQERAVSALSLKSSSEELGSYCLMWSLRPFIDDEIIEKAWSFIR